MVLTAARPKGREAAIQLTYGKTDITARIENDVESFHYTDVAASQSDTMSISSTMLELSNDRATQEEVQDVARCLRTLYSTPVGSLEGDRLLGIDPSVFLDKPLAVAKGLYVAEVTDKTATFEPRARVVRVDWVESDALHGVVTPKVVYELV